MEKKRKIIDLQPTTMRILGMMAVSNGLSLKAYIERILEKEAANVNEDAILLALSKEPEANMPVSSEEEIEIRNMLKQSC